MIIRCFVIRLCRPHGQVTVGKHCLWRKSTRSIFSEEFCVADKLPILSWSFVDSEAAFLSSGIVRDTEIEFNGGLACVPAFSPLVLEPAAGLLRMI